MGSQLKVLIACEFSGTVRDAFSAFGHYAVSCDLLPTIKPGEHWIGDCRDVIEREEWDLMIAHPPCTFLCSSGLHRNNKTPGRPRLTKESLRFVHYLLKAPIPHIALENPVGCISTRLWGPSQVIQPWHYGHPESKTTCLWLKALPRLIPTRILKMPKGGRWNNQTRNGQNKLPPSKDRWKIRSLTYPGIARAMAEQWTAYLQPDNPFLTDEHRKQGDIFLLRI